MRFMVNTSVFTRLMVIPTLTAFVFSTVFSSRGYAQTFAPVQLVTVQSAATDLVRLTGLTFSPDNPLEMDFWISTGEANWPAEELNAQVLQLARYFLASLTIPEDQLWVNLSPYEENRIIEPAFGSTEMGRDLLAQDYVLKQITASLMNPEGEAGKKFWEKVYEKIYDVGADLRGPTTGGHIGQPLQNTENSTHHALRTTDLIESFNKVWIVPKTARIYQDGFNVHIVESELMVMLESDYLAEQEHNKLSSQRKLGPSGFKNDLTSKDTGSSIEVEDDSFVVKNIIKETIIPFIEDEVNHGPAFANLRQIFDALILAAWFKQNLRESFLGQVYVDQEKTDGVVHGQPGAEKEIYEQYLEAFRSGAADIIREEYDPVTQNIVPRRYFTGGVDATEISKGMLVEHAAKTLNFSTHKYHIGFSGQIIKNETSNAMLVELLLIVIAIVGFIIFFKPKSNSSSSLSKDAMIHELNRVNATHNTSNVLSKVSDFFLKQGNYKQAKENAERGLKIDRSGWGGVRPLTDKQRYELMRQQASAERALKKQFLAQQKQRQRNQMVFAFVMIGLFISVGILLVQKKWVLMPNLKISHPLFSKQKFYPKPWFFLKRKEASFSEVMRKF